MAVTEPSGPRMRRVGHKGADLIVPGNTIASFEAAVANGVDMIEFDVLPMDPREPRSAPLVLAHDYQHDLAEAATLADGLAHLAATGLDLNLDLKLAGYEDRVVDALREFGLVERTLISTMERDSLRRLRELEPSLRLGWSVPKARRDYTQSRLYRLPALGLLAYARQVLPRQAAQAIQSGFCDALMAYWRLVSPALVRSVREAGGELYAWTVDDGDQIRRLERLGVTGVITNDPRLFS